MSVKINLDSLFCLQIYFTRNSLNTYARWRDTFVTNYTGAQLQFTCLHGGYLCFWQDGNTTDVNKEQKSRNYLEPSSQTSDNRPRDAEARDCATGCRSLSPISRSVSNLFNARAHVYDARHLLEIGNKAPRSLAGKHRARENRHGVRRCTEGSVSCRDTIRVVGVCRHSSG